MVDTIRKRIGTGHYLVEVLVTPPESLTENDHYHIIGETGNWMIKQNGVKVCPWNSANLLEAETWIRLNHN